MSHRPGWPVALRAGSVELRPPKLRDAKVWSEIRLRNQSWLEPWEPTSPYPWAERNSAASWPQLNSALRKAARAGTMLPFMLLADGKLAGQVNASNVVHGVQRSCTIGYWIDGAQAGRGIVPTAVALLIDHCFSGVGLHRVEINIRPENVASLRVVEKLGLRREGFYERYLDIDGAWRDHIAFAVTIEELNGGTMLSRLPPRTQRP